MRILNFVKLKLSSIDSEIVLRVLKWVEKVRNYGNWRKILGVLKKGIFDKIIIIIIII